MPLNVDQFAEDKAPLFVAEAVGTFKVITGVVVPVATVLDKSVPVVPKVNAATEVTVPTPTPPTKANVPVAKGKVYVYVAFDIVVPFTIKFPPSQVCDVDEFPIQVLFESVALVPILLYPINILLEPEVFAFTPTLFPAPYPIAVLLVPALFS